MRTESPVEPLLYFKVLPCFVLRIKLGQKFEGRYGCFAHFRSLFTVLQQNRGAQLSQSIRGVKRTINKVFNIASLSICEERLTPDEPLQIFMSLDVTRILWSMCFNHSYVAFAAHIRDLLCVPHFVQLRCQAVSRLDFACTKTMTR